MKIVDFLCFAIWKYGTSDFFGPPKINRWSDEPQIFCGSTRWTNSNLESIRKSVQKFFAIVLMLRSWIRVISPPPTLLRVNMFPINALLAWCLYIFRFLFGKSYLEIQYLQISHYLEILYLQISHYLEIQYLQIMHYLEIQYFILTSQAS